MLGAEATPSGPIGGTDLVLEALTLYADTGVDAYLAVALHVEIDPRDRWLRCGLAWLRGDPAPPDCAAEAEAMEYERLSLLGDEVWEARGFADEILRRRGGA